VGGGAIERAWWGGAGTRHEPRRAWDVALLLAYRAASTTPSRRPSGGDQEWDVELRLKGGLAGGRLHLAVLLLALRCDEHG
jgi:hypothetical protein